MKNITYQGKGFHDSLHTHTCIPSVVVRPVLISSYTSGSCTLREVPCDAHDTFSQDTSRTTLAATLLD